MAFDFAEIHHHDADCQNQKRAGQVVFKINKPRGYDDYPRIQTKHDERFVHHDFAAGQFFDRARKFRGA